jgi:hypothetical protein
LLQRRELLLCLLLQRRKLLLRLLLRRRELLLALLFRQWHMHMAAIGCFQQGSLGNFVFSIKILVFRHQNLD